jgi:hypothetical protein
MKNPRLEEKLDTTDIRVHDFSLNTFLIFSYNIVL